MSPSAPARHNVACGKTLWNVARMRSRSLRESAPVAIHCAIMPSGWRRAAAETRRGVFNRLFPGFWVEQELARPEPEASKAGDPEELRAVLDSALDTLGAAHHRPFSRG